MRSKVIKLLKDVTDGGEPFDLLQLFVKHIIQVFDGLFLKCDFNFLQPHGSR